MIAAAALSSPTTSQTQWHWKTWEGLPYLTCELLKDWSHGFFTQGFYPHTPETLVGILQPEATPYRLKQVHGNRVLTPSEIEREKQQLTEQEFPSADGSLTERENQAVWVASADCTPVLIGDVATGRTAALHAGWRGTAQKIVPEAVSRFLASGSQLDDLRVALGPAIAGEVYQVTEGVAAEVGSSLIKNGETEALEGIIEQLQSLSSPPIHPDPEPGRVRLDVRRVNALQLEQLGFTPEQVAIAPCCTYQQPDYFFSYRRTNQKKVQWSGIVSR
ncbi:peptidoglycan editing factor PgeF [Spirulina subsalsa]|uniref:peptidoglycan editing factor PgeF n=1 Tax=Spirulina subsalsa TaxID=54311 RepID=UPI0002F98FC8|nr:peptidoglycan editing factor PgeF [Spirulina subsalsa]